LAPGDGEKEEWVASFGRRKSGEKRSRDRERACEKEQRLFVAFYTRGNARRKSHAHATRLCHVTTEEPGKDGLQCLERFPGNCGESVENWKFS